MEMKAGEGVYYVHYVCYSVTLLDYSVCVCRVSGEAGRHSIGKARQGRV